MDLGNIPIQIIDAPAQQQPVQRRIQYVDINNMSLNEALQAVSYVQQPRQRQPRIQRDEEVKLTRPERIFAFAILGLFLSGISFLGISILQHFEIIEPVSKIVTLIIGGVFSISAIALVTAMHWPEKSNRTHGI